MVHLGYLLGYVRSWSNIIHCFFWSAGLDKLEVPHTLGIQLINTGRWIPNTSSTTSTTASRSIYYNNDWGKLLCNAFSIRAWGIVLHVEGTTPFTIMIRSTLHRSPRVLVKIHDIDTSSSLNGCVFSKLYSRSRSIISPICCSWHLHSPIVLHPQVLFTVVGR